MNRRSFLRSLLSLPFLPSALTALPAVVSAPEMDLLEYEMMTTVGLDVTRVDIFDRFEYNWKMVRP